MLGIKIGSKLGSLALRPSHLITSQKSFLSVRAFSKCQQLSFLRNHNEGYNKVWLPIQKVNYSQNSLFRRNVLSSKSTERFPRNNRGKIWNSQRLYTNGRNNNSGSIINNIMINSFLLVRAMWNMVPDFLKLFLGFAVVSYFLIFIALPLLFIALPLLFLFGFLFGRARSLFRSRILKTYSSYLSTSSLKLSGNNVVGFNNYNHPAKLLRLSSLVSRRINLAFEFNENNVQNILKPPRMSLGSQNFVDSRSFDSKLHLSDVVSVKSESVISTNGAMQDNEYDALLIYEFMLLESNFRNPKQLKNVAQVNLIVGRPKQNRGGFDNERIFEELFETKHDDEVQPFIIEIVPTGFSFNRFVINSESEFDTLDTDRIITINKHKTRTFE